MSNLTIRQAVQGMLKLQDSGDHATMVGIGPMSPNLIQAVFELAKDEDFPPMFIASRNQVDMDEMGAGYVNGWDQTRFAADIMQHYAGESGLSYGSQLCVIIFMMFTSAASGYAACMAFCRGVSGRKMGNFYEDVIRVTTRILIPFSFVIGLLLVSQGVPQTLQANETIQTIEGKMQDLALGPVAALEAIKHLGTNGVHSIVGCAL